SHAAAVGAAAADRPTDVQQGRLLLPGAESDLPAGTRPVPGGPGDRPGPRARLHVVGAQPVAGDTGALRAAVLVDRPGYLGVDRRKHRRRGALPSAGGAARSRPDRLGDTATGSPLRRRRGQRAVAGGGQPAADHASGRWHPQRGADARADADRDRVRTARYRLRAPAVAATMAAGQWTPSGLGAAGHAAGRGDLDRAVLADQVALAAGAGLRHDGV